MGWAVGEYEGRDIGYGVPATCDHPGCGKSIDRGLGYVCANGEIYGGEEGCGRFFCGRHGGASMCERCASGGPPFDPTPDVPLWINHKLTDPSWQQWRDENPAEVVRLTEDMES